MITGHGSLGLELLADRPDLDTVLVPVGGGGLISGVATAVKLLKPASASSASSRRTPMWSAAASRPANRRSSRPLGRRRRPGRARLRHPQLPVIQQYVDEVVRVSEDALIEATRLVMSRTKLALEPAAAAPFAALLEDKLQPEGLTAGVVSGGNLDVAKLRF